MQEQSQLISAAEAYVAARLSVLQTEDPEAYRAIDQKLEAGKGKITLVIARNERNWRCTALMQGVAESFETIELFSFQQPIESGAGRSPETDVPAGPMPSEPSTSDQKAVSSLSVDQFFDELERCRELFVWRFQADIPPGIERRSSPRLWICAVPRGEAGVRLDPVQAVCYATTGLQEELKAAAERIGLSPTDASSLNAAAADRTWKGPNGNRKPDQYLSKLRERILESIGIKRRPATPSGVGDPAAASSGEASKTRHEGENEPSKDLLHDSHHRPGNRLGMKDLRE